MVAARTPRMLLGLGRYERVIESIDWNRILIQARGEHAKTHPNLTIDNVCGECIRSVLLRMDD